MKSSPPNARSASEIFENFAEALVTTTYLEHNGQTTMAMLMTCPTTEIHDVVLKTGSASSCT